MSLSLLVTVSSFKLLADTAALRERTGSGNSCWDSELLCQHLHKSDCLSLSLSTSSQTLSCSVRSCTKKLAAVPL